jgi:methylisocitrate lyase
MTAKTSLKAMLANGEQIWAPCVYDCLSAKIVEMAGYKGLMLSSMEMAIAGMGVPDGLMNVEELVWTVSRIAASSNLPLVVDGESGGATPLEVYRLCKRIAAAGAMGITIEDTGGHWFADYEEGDGSLMDANVWATHIKAAATALKGTDCLLIARTNAKGGGLLESASYMGNALGIDEAIRRCNMGLDAGADMTLIMDINHEDCMDEVREVSKRVPGWKMYPDIKAGLGVPDVDLDEIMSYGFNFVTSHGAMKGAFKGMYDYAVTNLRNRSTQYSENDEFGLGHNYMDGMFDDWIENAREFKSYAGTLGK